MQVEGGIGCSEGLSHEQQQQKEPAVVDRSFGPELREKF